LCSSEDALQFLLHLLIELDRFGVSLFRLIFDLLEVVKISFDHILVVPFLICRKFLLLVFVFVFFFFLFFFFVVL
jgi:hypothetical protein